MELSVLEVGKLLGDSIGLVGHIILSGTGYLLSSYTLVHYDAVETYTSSGTEIWVTWIHNVHIRLLGLLRMPPKHIPGGIPYNCPMLISCSGLENNDTRLPFKHVCMSFHSYKEEM